MKNKAVFLDRDGVLIEDTGYPHLPEHLKIKEDIIPYLIRLKKNNFLLIIVTNQSGIAKGYFTVSQYRDFQKLLLHRLSLKGADIDATYFSPYHNEGTVPKYSLNHDDRKPAPGMIIKAAKDFDINLSDSLMIGDRETDIINHPLLKTFIIQGRYPVSKNITVYKDYQSLFTAAGIDI